MNSPHDGEFQTFLTPQKGEPSILSFGTDGTDNLAASSNRSFLSRKTRDWPFLTISMLLVVLSALCIHLLFQLHDLRASSMGLLPIPAVRDICFVHVGKTGGNSITTSLHALRALGSIGGAVEVHTSHDWPIHYKDVVMPSDEETVKRISSGLSPRNMTYRNTTHEGRHWWVQDSGFYAEAATMLRHYRRLGAPLSNATRKSAQYCPMTGHVVTWVRDPVSRLIRLCPKILWNGLWMHSLFGPCRNSGFDFIARYQAMQGQPLYRHKPKIVWLLLLLPLLPNCISTGRARATLQRSNVAARALPRLPLRLSSATSDLFD